MKSYNRSPTNFFLQYDIALLSLFRILAGIGGAAMFISGAALVAACWPDNPAHNAFGMALYVGGGGIGILASALLLPPMLSADGAENWPLAWLVLGGLAMLAWLATMRIVGRWTLRSATAGWQGRCCRGARCCPRLSAISSMALAILSI